MPQHCFICSFWGFINNISNLPIQMTLLHFLDASPPHLAHFTLKFLTTILLQYPLYDADILVMAKSRDNAILKSKCES